MNIVLDFSAARCSSSTTSSSFNKFWKNSRVTVVFFSCLVSVALFPPYVIILENKSCFMYKIINS